MAILVILVFEAKTKYITYLACKLDEDYQLWMVSWCLSTNWLFVSCHGLNMVLHSILLLATHPSAYTTSESSSPSLMKLPSDLALYPPAHNNSEDPHSW